MDMDTLYGQDQNGRIIEDSEIGGFMGDDVFSNTDDMNMDNLCNDWFNSLFDDPILNDKMMTDAVQSPRIQSEHSYSLNNEPSSPLGLGKIEDIDSEFFSSSQGPIDMTRKSTVLNPLIVKQEPIVIDPVITSSNATTSISQLPSSSSQPTIILAPSTTSHNQSQMTVLPKISIKSEPLDCLEQVLEQTVNLDSMILPPTPPSSSNSDSDGSLSPQRSAPSSPIRSPCLRSSDEHISFSPSMFGSSSSSSRTVISQPLFTNPIPQSGILTLTDEEKRTLITEGYPIPSKLPLTKQEEKNLKKIRRKIKNKISAQESRRKKKEYLEALERRVEQFNQENIDLKKKVDSLETNNRSLLSQLQRLQTLVGKASPTQAGSVLMVLVLCFAVFMGSWAPSLNIGYSTTSSLPGPAIPFTNPYLRTLSPAMGPKVENAKSMCDDPYSTPNMKSRVLMGIKDELDGESDIVRPQLPSKTGSEGSNAETVNVGPEKLIVSEPPYKPETSDVSVTVKDEAVKANCSSCSAEHQATMHPDIAVPVVNPFNGTAEIETA